jgi:hypothetical protein
MAPAAMAAAESNDIVGPSVIQSEARIVSMKDNAKPADGAPLRVFKTPLRCFARSSHFLLCEKTLSEEGVRGLSLQTTYNTLDGVRQRWRESRAEGRLLRGTRSPSAVALLPPPPLFSPLFFFAADFRSFSFCLVAAISIRHFSHRSVRSSNTSSVASSRRAASRPCAASTRTRTPRSR